jgi:DNA-binding LacI/PurR family transcriptional regulator
MTEPPPRRPRPTLAQIASELGVSVMSVSNAYNRPDQLSGALRERILAKAQELGYPGPDPLGRGLRRQRTGALGVLYATWPSYVFTNPAAVGFLQGLTEITGRAFMGVLLVPSPLPEDTEELPLDSALVDGFVVYSVADDDRQVPIARSRAPVVVVDQPRIDGVPTVGIDDEAAATGAAQHLIDLGHRQIAVLAFGLARDGAEGFAGPERRQRATFAVTRARLSGYRSALSAAGIDWDAVPVYECPMPRDAGVAARELLALRPRPTALVAMSDGLALGAVRAARELGLTVPGDLSVVGFDDSPAAERTGLTTVRQPHIAKGRRAGELLLGLLAGQPVADRELLPTELVVRGSTSS